jgi:hypothetical protein
LSLRRLFWLGAAILFSIAALVAIAAVLGGSFGDTQARILETCGIAFVCGAAALAGLACLDHGVIQLAAWAAIALGVASFVVWTGGAWAHTSSDVYWKLAGVLGVWTLLALVITTLRLLASSPRVLSTAVPATWAAAVLTGLVATEMILAGDGGPWQLLVVLVILSALGYALTPALQRFWSAADAPQAAERLLGALGDIEVFAVRGDRGSVTIGSTRTRLEASEGIVLRERGAKQNTPVSAT